MVRENEWFAAYELLTHLVGDDGHAPARLPADPRQPRPPRAWSASSTSSSWAASTTGSSGGTPAATGSGSGSATYADRLEEVIEARLRTGDPLPGTDGRITMGPLKIISDGSLNTRTAWCCEPYADGARLDAAGRRGQPPRGRAHRAARPRAHVRSRGGDPRDRRRRGRRRAGCVRRHRRPRLDRARPADRPRRRTPDRRAGPAGQRAARPPARRPRPHRADLAGPGRSVVRVPLDARRRGAAVLRLGRARLTPGPLAGDGGRGAPQRRRPAGLASRAGADRARGAGRVGGRPADGGRRLARRPGAARPATRWPRTPTRRPPPRGCARPRSR